MNKKNLMDLNSESASLQPDILSTEQRWSTNKSVNKNYLQSIPIAILWRDVIKSMKSWCNEPPSSGLVPTELWTGSNVSHAVTPSIWCMQIMKVIHGKIFLFLNADLQMYMFVNFFLKWLQNCTELHINIYVGFIPQVWTVDKLDASDSPPSVRCTGIVTMTNVRSDLLSRSSKFQ